MSESRLEPTCWTRIGYTYCMRKGPLLWISGHPLKYHVIWLKYCEQNYYYFRWLWSSLEVNISFITEPCALLPQCTEPQSPWSVLSAWWFHIEFCNSALKFRKSFQKTKQPILDSIIRTLPICNNKFHRQIRLSVTYISFLLVKILYIRR